MNAIVAYDISDDRRRSHVVNLLLDYGQRVQESVFWLDASPDLIDRMKSRLSAAVDPAQDSVWIVSVCEACRRKIETSGPGRVPGTPEAFIV